MEEKEILVIKDFDKIKDVKFTDPNLMADDAKEQIAHLYYSIKELENKLYATRQEVRDLEQLLQDRKKDYQRIAPLFELEFETVEKEYTTHKSELGIMGLGNDIIGRSSMV